MATGPLPTAAPAVAAAWKKSTPTFAVFHPYSPPCGIPHTALQCRRQQLIQDGLKAKPEQRNFPQVVKFPHKPTRKGSRNMPKCPTRWFEKPKWRNSGWFKVSLFGMLFAIALGDITLVLTAIIAFDNHDWSGLSILILTAVFITIAPIMLILRVGDILFPPETEHGQRQSAETRPTTQPATGLEETASE